MMRFHFLNVGHGDCTFIELPDNKLMLVDINNSKSLPDEDIEMLSALHSMNAYDFTRPGSYGALQAKSWEDYYSDMLVDPVDYYKAHFDGRGIFRYVQTHPDMDHMSGLYRLFWQERVKLWNFWDNEHTKKKSEEDFKNSPHAYTDWLAYTLLRVGISPVDQFGNRVTHKVMKNKRHHTGDYWTGHGMKVLSPTPELVRQSNEIGNWNDASYVLRFEHGGRSVILAGDAERAAWESMVGGVHSDNLSCDVLKAAHHGRESGFHDQAVEAMNPSAVICSVGKKPSTDAHDAYRKKGAEVFSTRFKGTLVLTLWDDGEVWLDDAKNNRLFKLDPIA